MKNYSLKMIKYSHLKQVPYQGLIRYFWFNIKKTFNLQETNPNAKSQYEPLAIL